MKTLKPALLTFGMLTLLTGVIYPLCITGISALIFPHQARGSLLLDAGQKPIGSEWLAQDFKSPRYFWPRPSAAGYGTIPSGASNQGPTSAALKQAINDRGATLRQAHSLPTGAAVPEELTQASGSGLDPHLSPETVRFQMDRVCQARGLDARHREAVTKIITELTEAPFAGVMGAWRINVLQLNLRLDALK